MISEIANLICDDGHKAYSPEPDEWIGLDCNTNGCRCPIKKLDPELKKWADPVRGIVFQFIPQTIQSPMVYKHLKPVSNF